MNQYTIFCTEEQARKAFKLGAPIEIFTMYEEFINWPKIKCADGNCRPFMLPTTEQMLGWLKDQGIYAWVRPEFWARNNKHNVGFVHIISKLGTPIIETGEINEQVLHKSYREAVLASIDAALDYLKKEEDKE